VLVLRLGSVRVRVRVSVSVTARARVSARVLNRCYLLVSGSVRVSRGVVGRLGLGLGLVLVLRLGSVRVRVRVRVSVSVTARARVSARVIKSLLFTCKWIG